MSDAESRAYCERVFAPDLGGKPLVSNKSVWRNFPLLANERWHFGNRVLIGDALRTGHFSIGSGTRLAFDDAIALARVFEEKTPVEKILQDFENQRRPIVEKIVAAANKSSYWYETFPERMKQDPWQLAYDYMTRSGRMTDERLQAEAPRFFEAAKRRLSPGGSRSEAGRS
jgi:2-polyprenyl-6-methoxyphenol hydroxylase-like FAD-dependent oxidoreductase